MMTPMSITSLNQGRELALWHIGRLYADGPGLVGEPDDPQTIVGLATPAEHGAGEERRSTRSFWAAFRRRLRSVLGRNLEASAAS